MSYPEALKQIGVNEDKIKIIDIREDSKAEIIGDYLEINIEKLCGQDLK